MAAAPQPSRRKIIKKSGGHGHHGGAWKIAYADFVTAMMALFMVLWLLASTDSKSRKEIADYFRTGVLPDAELAMNGGATYVPSIMEKSGVPPPHGEQSLDDQARSVQKQIRTMADNHVDLAEVASKVRVVATPEGVLIEVDDSDDGMLFETSSSALKPALRDFLVKLVPVLASRDAPIEIQGHTDAAPFPTGADKTNWELSFERASAARKILERAGLGRDRVVGVIGRGAAVPLLPDAPLSARNRRLSILLRSSPVASGAPPTIPPGGPTPPPEGSTPPPEGSTAPLTDAAKDGDGQRTASVRAMIRGTTAQARRLLEP